MLIFKIFFSYFSQIDELSIVKPSSTLDIGIFTKTSIFDEKFEKIIENLDFWRKFGVLTNISIFGPKFEFLTKFSIFYEYFNSWR